MIGCELHLYFIGFNCATESHYIMRIGKERRVKAYACVAHIQKMVEAQFKMYTKWNFRAPTIYFESYR